RILHVWDVATGDMIAEPFQGHTNAVRSVAFSPNGQQIVSGSFDQTVRVWDMKTGQVTTGSSLESGSLGLVTSAIFPKATPTAGLAENIIKDTMFGHSFNLVNGWV